MPWVDLTDVRSYYEWSGRGETVLLIGGLGSPCDRWDPVVPALSEHFCTLRVDPRDIGGATGKRTATSMAHYAADLVELLDHLQLERVHVVGLSWGGVLAQRLASDHPGRVGRLVLISCTHRFTAYLREMGRLVAYMLRHANWPMFLRLMELLGSGPIYLDADPEAMVARVQEKGRMNIPRRAVGRQLHCLLGCDAKTWRGPLTMPTLVVAGEYDPLNPHCYARDLAASIPGSRFVLLNDAGHNPVCECPDQLLAHLLPFLRGEPAAEAAWKRTMREPIFPEAV